MKKTHTVAGWLMLLALSTLNLQPSTAFAQGTAFTYQGRLNVGGSPASGRFDLTFSLFNAGSGGTQIGSTVTNLAVGVTNGLFTTTLDFGSVFSGNATWLQIAVRTNGVGAYTALAPLQQLTPTPYALFAPSAGSAATVAPNAITAAGIQNAAITAAKIAPGQLVKSLNGLSDNVALAAGPNVSLATNANKLTISAAGGGATGGWTTTGNSGTDPTVNFLGTTDGQPLILQANNVGINTNNPQATLHVAGTVLATQFAGDGSGLTNLQTALATPFTFMTLLCQTSNAGYAYGVAVAGHYAYLANGPDGLRVYDVSLPAQPVSVGDVSATQLPGSASSVTVSGNLAFVTVDDGLAIVDITTPSQPTVLAHITIASGYARSVAVSGNYAYVAANTALLIYSVSDPRNPAMVSQVNLTYNANGVAVSGNFAYLANDLDGLRIYNVANPANPTSVAHVVPPPNTSASSVAVSGNLAYLASGDIGLSIYDVSNPANPVPLGSTAESYALSVAVSGHYAYLACYPDGLLIYDVSDPTNPLTLAVAPEVSGGLAYAVAVSGNYAYVANDNGLWTCFAGPLASVPGAVAAATGFLGDGWGLTNLNAGQLSGQLASPILSGLWQSTGNAGTTPAQNFLGTTDNQPLEFRANDQPVLLLQPGGDVTIDPGSTNNGALLPGLTFGASSGEGIASKRTSGGNQFGLDFFTGSTSRMSIDNAGDIQIGANSPNAILNINAFLDIQNNTRINDNDILLRGGSDTNHGIGWYGDVKPFGLSQPDGPVVYGYHGGVLGTTVGGPNASLAWDSGQVQVAKDLNVGGQVTVAGNITAYTISADNVPGVNWDQTGGGGYTNVSDSADVVLASCSNNANHPSGFFVILGSATVDVNANYFDLILWDITEPAIPLNLTSARYSSAVMFPAVLTGHVGTLTLTWVVPISGAANQTFALVGHTDGGSANVYDHNLTVMYFPQMNN